GTRMPPVRLTSSGPKWSTKHHGPMRLRLRWGRVRRTSMARGPPSGTSRAVTMSTVSAQRTWAHSYSAGSISVLVTRGSSARADGVLGEDGDTVVGVHRDRRPLDGGERLVAQDA